MIHNYTVLSKLKYVLVFALISILGISTINAQVLVEEDFSSGSLPAGWTNTDLSGAGLVWDFTNPGGWFITGGDPGFDENFAIFDSDYYGGGFFPYEEAGLETPSFDASVAGSYFLEFDNSFVFYDLGESYALIEVWDGTSWVPFDIYTVSDGDEVANHKLYDITAATGGSPTAKVRFVFGNGNWDYFWAIDNVKITRSDCVSATGTANVVSDCAAMTYMIEMTIDDLGDATSMIFTDGIDEITVSAPGVYEFGPYAVGTTQVIEGIHPDNPLCNVATGMLGSLECGPDNDDCEGATEVTVNEGPSCDAFVTGTTFLATGSSVGMSDCAWDEISNDVWFKFTATGVEHILSIYDIEGYEDLYFSIYTGDCESLTEAYCANSTGASLTGFESGTEYYVRIWTEFSEGEATNFKFCVSSPGEGSTCADPIDVTTVPYSHTSSTTYYGDYLSFGVAGTSCGESGADFDYLSGNDVVYEFTPSFTGNVNIGLSGFGESAYAGVFVYASCDDIGIACIDGATGSDEYVPLEINDFAVTSGTSYYIVVSNWASPQTIDYTLTITTDDEVPCEYPEVTIASPEICAGNSATLTPSSTIEGTVFTYYNADMSEVLGTGTSFTSPILTTTTTYYIVGLNDTCASEAVEAIIIVNENPTVEVAPVSVCTGNAATLTATSSVAGAVFEWYDSETATSSIFTGASFETPTLTEDVTYYVEAQNGTCISSRIAVTVTVESLTITAEDASICAGSTATLTAVPSTTATVNWYDAPTGGTLLGTGESFATEALTAGATYYVEAVTDLCSTERIAVNVTIETLSIIADEVSICAGNTATLTAVPSIESTVNWYDAATGGTLLGTGTAYTTEILTATAIYYVEAVTDLCSSERIAVNVNVTAIPDVVSESITICNEESVTLTASSSSATAIFEWYADETETTPLFTGATFATPVITSATTYYVAAIDGTCTSARLPVVITLNSINITTEESIAVCIGSAAALTATSDDETAIIEWYDVATGGVALATGSSYTTTSITSPAVYYVQAVNGTCTSERIAINVSTITSTDVFAAGVATCGPSAVTLTATSSVVGAIFNWYDSETATTPLYTGAEYLTDVISATTIFYVQASAGDCISERLAVEVNIGGGTPPTITALSSRVCISGSATIEAGSSATDATFEWYDAPTGGTLLSTGSIFTTPEITTSTIYYVQAVVADCTSERFAVTALVVNPTISAAPVEVCHGESATVVATSIPSGVIRWYADETSTTVLHTGGTYVTPALTSTTTYYLTSTVHGCVSSRFPVTVVVKPAIDITSSDVSLCVDGEVTLTANTTTAGAVISWYDVPSGGVALAEGTEFVTPYLTGPTVYYVEASFDGCTSERLAINIVAGLPPDVTASAAGSVCISGTTVLNASSTSATAVFYWYDVPSGGTELHIGASFTTPTISAATTYYVEANSLGCISERIPVNVTITNPTVTVQNDTVCISGSGVLTGIPGATGTIIRWYDSPTGPHVHSGSTFTTPSLTTTTTYYVTATLSGCITERTPVTVVVNEVPDLTISEPTLCISGSGTITVSTTDYDEITYEWFAAATGGSAIGSGSTFVSPVITTTTTYYVQPAIEGCTFPRIPVTITVNNPIPTVSDVYVCGPSSTTLTASGVTGAVYRWYTSLTATTSIYTGATYTTPVLSTSTTYYVTATVDGCQGQRTPVTVDVRPIPNVTGTGTMICGPGTATVTATSTTAGATFEWYSAATGGTLLGTGSPFTTGTISTTTTIYVASIANGCTSATRVPVVITVNPVPVVTASATNVCMSGTSTLTATSSIAGSTIEWFTSMGATTPLATGPSYTTGVISSSITLYVSARVGGCTSTRIAVPINVINPVITTSDVTICDTQSVTLVATSTGTGPVIEWFTAPTGGTAIATGSTFLTPVLNTTTTYYVSSTLTGCTSNRVPVTVTVNTYEYTIIPGSVCEMGTVTLFAEIDDASAVTEWYDDLAMSTLLHTGSSFTTPSLTTTTTYYFRAVTMECATNLRPIVATVNPLPLLTVDPTTAMVCPGDTVTFTALEDPDYSYLWSDGSTSNIYQTNEYGNHTVTVTDEFGCQSSMTVFLDTIVSPTLEGFDFVPNIFSNPYMYNFTPIDAVGATGYYWEFGDGNTSDEYSPNHEYAAFGTYIVTLNVFNECDTATVSLEIYVRPTNGIDNFDDVASLDIYPNPTSSELNIEIKNADKITNVKVFNQLGQMMSAEDVDKKDLYTLNVQRLAQGSYYVIITTKDGKTAVRKFVIQ